MSKIKRRPEDFKVTEVLKEPLKERGKFGVYKLWKRGLTTEEALRLIAKSSNISKNQISICGIKDRHAETTQFIAVKAGIKLREVNSKSLKLSFAGYTNRKLSPRSLKGNRFEIVVREANPLSSKRLGILKEQGIPNYYGEQRFLSVKEKKTFFQVLINKGGEEALKFLFLPSGWEESRNRKGKKLFLNGRFKEAAELFRGWRRKVALFLSSGGSIKDAFNLVPREELIFQANVFQSLLFNEKLSSLIDAGCRKKVKFLYRAGTLFYPLEKVKLPENLPMFCLKEAKAYNGLLNELGLSLEEFSPYWNFFHEFQRKTVIKPEDLLVENSSSLVKLSFLLPPGAYATNIVRFLFNSVEVL